MNILSFFRRLEASTFTYLIITLNCLFQMFPTPLAVRWWPDSRPDRSRCRGPSRGKTTRPPSSDTSSGQGKKPKKISKVAQLHSVFLIGWPKPNARSRLKPVSDTLFMLFPEATIGKSIKTDDVRNRWQKWPCILPRARFRERKQLKETRGHST